MNARSYGVRFLCGLGGAAALAFAGTSVTALLPARPASFCTPSWEVVPAAVDHDLGGVAAQSANDAWAIGWGTNLIEHWNGQQWSVSQASTDRSDWYGKVLNGVAAVGPSAAWAVGYRARGANLSSPNGWQSPLIESWNGKRWRFDHTPAFPGQRAWLNGVIAVAANNVWAVGTRSVRPAHGRWSVFQTLIEHWDGSTWKRIPSPNIGPATNKRTRKGWEPASDNRLVGVTAVSARNIWAVGEYAFPHHVRNKPYYSSTFGVRPMAERWNGSHWAMGPRVHSSTNPAWYPDDFSPGQEGFTAVAASPSGGVLALRGYQGAWRLAGLAWSRISQSPPLDFGPNAVTETAHNDAWMLGNTYDTHSDVAAHWDGQAWTRTNLPADGPIYAAAASAPNDVWADGGLQSLPLTGSPKEVLLHYTC